MGKQINFYMSKQVQTSFVEYLEQNQFVFLDYNAQRVEQPLSTNVYGLYLYKQTYGDVIMRQDLKQIIDIIKSPIIEFSKTTIKLEEKKVLQGRIWISDQYYDENGALIKKNEEFVKDYKILNRWIRKNVPYQEVRKGEFIVKEYVNDDLKELQEKGFVLTL